MFIQTYGSEADIRRFFTLGLKDAIAMLEVEGCVEINEFTIKLERSL